MAFIFDADALGRFVTKYRETFEACLLKKL
jgi:hypothetical protein